MDRPDVAADALAQGLADLRRVNRWFGGSRAALATLMPLVRELGTRDIRVLDVATGSADIPLALARRAGREGISLDVVATDLHRETLEDARRNTAEESAVTIAPADALALDFATGEFHIAMCHTALHHFSGSDARRLLAELGRVASRAIVVTDLARSHVAVAAVTVLARTLWHDHPVTRHDSVVSIRGAYTAAEAQELARLAGLRGCRTRHHPFFRFSLVARPGTAE